MSGLGQVSGRRTRILGNTGNTRGYGNARQGRQNNERQDDNFDDMMNIKMLSISVPGVPGDDYPILATVPQTSFR